MPLKYLRYLVPLATLLSLQGLAQQVPVRGLLAEQAAAGQGEAAIVHTHYGTGYGFFLTGKAEVLVSRHSVLTPQRTIADEIDVKYPQQPFNNFIENRSVPIAQDVVHDLVLLRIVDAAGTEVADTDAAGTDAAGRAAEAVPAVQTPVASPPCPAMHQVHRHKRHGRRRSRLRQAGFTRGSTTAGLRRTLAFSRNPRLRIIWDGSGSGSR